MLLGAIADDLTGATDLANTLQRQGLRTVQLVGVPASDFAVPDADAIVVALKSRTCPPAAAVEQSLASCRWLKAGGARQIYFKYCSTFDSTDVGNIGPVADALKGELGADFTIACPALPENGRTIFSGHLFVGRQLLSDSSMRHHPLTPMMDANLVAVLGRQTRAKVGLVPYAVVRQGARAIWKEFGRLREQGFGYAIADALEDRHLRDLGEAGAGLPLLTGGSGLAIGLARNFARLHGFVRSPEADLLPEVEGYAAVVSGSCSPATLGQVAYFQRTHESFVVDPMALATGADIAGVALAWARRHLGEKPILITASATPESVERVQAALGRERAGAHVEAALAEIAAGLVLAGVRRLVVAGGETSGAVAHRLALKALRIGPQIDPGVPWTLALGERPLLIAMKSGNFGAADFFEHALAMVRPAGKGS